MKKIIAPILLLLIIAVLAGIGYKTFNNMQEEQHAQQELEKIQTVTGLIGSEKKPFFNDPEVQRILRDNYKLEVNFQTAGSREIATKVTPEMDFAFPSGEPAAEKIKQGVSGSKSYRVFFTPMTVASWQSVVDVLEKNQIVEKRQSYYGILDMQKLLGLMQNGMRWKDLPNNQSFNIGRKVLIKSTNITKSNSAAMYLSLASYLLNNEEIVSNRQEASAVIPKVTPLFSNQGFQANSSATPFNDYLIKGMGNSPMVMMYESQYLYEATQNDGIRPKMVLLYPEPTIFTQHILLGISDAGNQLGEALTSNEALQRLAIKHGFRSNNASLTKAFEKNLADKGLNNIPNQLNEVIDPPNYDFLEQMITGIEQAM